jgi:hypothetical protein
LRKIGLETVIERDFNWVHELERDMMEERGTGEEAMNLRERSLEEKEEEEIAERKRGVIVVEDEKRMIEREEREGC